MTAVTIQDLDTAQVSTSHSTGSGFAVVPGFDYTAEARVYSPDTAGTAVISVDWYDHGWTTTGFAHDPAGRLTERTDSAGVTRFGYDPRGFREPTPPDTIFDWMIKQGKTTRTRAMWKA